MITEEDKDKLIATLTLQLQEKEKEIEIKTEILLEKDKEIEYYKSWFEDDDYEKHNQDKISFCIEQLEKVKNRIESKAESIYKKLDELNIKIVCESTSRQLDAYEEISKEIDNQIKQLKGVK